MPQQPVPDENDHHDAGGAVLDAVRTGRADLGLIEAPSDLAGLASRAVGQDVVVLVAAPGDPWARRRKPLSPTEISRRRLTSREPGSGTRQVVEDSFRGYGVAPLASEVELTTTAAVLAAVRAGGPPAFVSNLAARDETSTGRLVEIPVADLDLRRNFTAVWVGRSTPPPGPVRDLLAIATRTMDRPGTVGSENRVRRRE